MGASAAGCGDLMQSYHALFFLSLLFILSSMLEIRIDIFYDDGSCQYFQELQTQKLYLNHQNLNFNHYSQYLKLTIIFKFIKMILFEYYFITILNILKNFNFNYVIEVNLFT